MQASDSDLLVIDNELLRRFGGRGPRYTSYPTADRFDDRVGPERYGQALQARAARRGEPLGLYVHIPFCRSICYYCACNKIGTKHASAAAPYLAALEREVALVTALTGTGQPISHLHFGGGTPTFISDEELGALIDMLHRSFEFRDDGEYSIEVDPRTVSPRRAHALRAMGLNRVSLGVQDFDPVVQAAVNRIQPYRQTVELMEAARAAGFRSINVDLIYGLPKQTLQSCLDTVEQCLAMRPDRFSIFGYAHVPEFKKHQRRIVTAELPDGEARHEQAEAMAQRLVAAGYVRIGLDHFALPDDPMACALVQGGLHRNFQGYTTDRCEALIGFGASAIGRLPQGYVQNEVVIGRYAEQIADSALPTARGYRLTAEDRLRAELIERVMCDLTVDIDAVCARHQADPSILESSFQRLGQLSQEGVVRLDGHRVSLPAEARLLVRKVASAFDAHLDQPPRQYSRAV